MRICFGLDKNKFPAFANTRKSQETLNSIHHDSKITIN